MTKKKKFELEYTVKSSPVILYEFVTSPSDLALWFADHVDTHGDLYTFVWDGNKENAELLECQVNKFARYRWEYQGEDEYFEFTIKQSDISQDTILVITDFADAKEIKDQSLLWDSQIKSLKQHIGGMG
jgi:uncharacterized protein YndB with AHSA1/START domain